MPQFPATGANVALGEALKGRTDAGLSELQIFPGLPVDSVLITEMERRALPGRSYLLRLALDGTDADGPVVPGAAEPADAGQGEPSVPETFVQANLFLRTATALDLAWTPAAGQTRLVLTDDLRFSRFFQINSGDAQLKVTAANTADGLDLPIHRLYTARVQSGPVEGAWTDLLSDTDPSRPLNLQTPVVTFEYPVDDAPTQPADPPDGDPPASPDPVQPPEKKLMARWNILDQAEEYETAQTTIHTDDPTQNETAAPVTGTDLSLDCTALLTNEEDNRAYQLIVRGLTPSCRTRGPGSPAPDIISPEPLVTVIEEQPDEGDGNDDPNDPVKRLAVNFPAAQNATLYYLEVVQTKNADGTDTTDATPTAVMLSQAYPVADADSGSESGNEGEGSGESNDQENQPDSGAPYVFKEYGVVPGATYRVSLRALGAGMIAAWSRTDYKVQALDRPVPVFKLETWQSGNDLLVAWPDVRTQDQIDAALTVTYEVRLYSKGENGDPVQIDPPTGQDPPPFKENTEAGRQYTVPYAKLAETDAFAVLVRGRAEGNTGPWNELPDLSPPPEATFVYAGGDGNPGTLKLSWDVAPGAQWYHARLYAPGQQMLTEAAPSDQATRELNQTYSGTSGTTPGAAVRTLAAGCISTIRSEETTVLGRPFLQPLRANFPEIGTASIQANWNYSRVGNIDVDFVVELYQGASGTGAPDWAPLLSQRVTPATQNNPFTYTFSDARLQAGVVYMVRVQASERAQPANTGAWSNHENAGGLPKVRGVQVVVTDSDDHTVAARWLPVAVSGIVYDLRVENPLGLAVDISPDESDSTVVMSAEVDGTDNVPYSFLVRARKVGDSTPYADGDVGPWSDPVGFMFTETDDDPEEKPGNQGNAPIVAEPINVAAGTYSYSRTLISVRGVEPVALNVYYNTFTPIDSAGPIGRRWGHEYSTRIDGAGTPGVSIRWGNGAVQVFQGPEGLFGSYQEQGVQSGSTLVYVVLEGATAPVYVLVHKNRKKFIFDESGRLSRVRSPIGREVVLTYSASGLDRVTDAGSGRYLVFACNADGTIQTISDGGGRTVALGYAGGDLVTITDPFRASDRTVADALLDTSITLRFAYWSGEDGPTSLLKTIADQKGRTFLYNEYESKATQPVVEKRRILLQQDARALALPAAQRYGVSFAYVPGRSVNAAATVLSTVTDREGFVSRYLCSAANGRVLAAVFFLEAGTPSATTPIKRLTRSYDPFLNLAGECIYEGPAGTDPFSNGRTDPGTTGPTEIQVAYLSDDRGRLTNVSYPGENDVGIPGAVPNQTAAYAYDVDGRLVTRTDDIGNQVRYVYDAQNLLRTVVGPTGGTRGRVYRGDASDAVSGADGRAIPGLVAREYEQFPAATGTLDPRQFAAYAFEYYSGENADGAPGDLKQVTDPAGNRTLYTWNASGFPASVRVFASGAVDPVQERTLEWDDAGRLKTYGERSDDQPAAAFTKFYYGYDENGNLASYTDALGGETIYEYDEDNRVRHVRYPPGSGPDIRRTFAYDREERLNRIQYGDDDQTVHVSQSFNYDGIGRWLSGTNEILVRTDTTRGVGPVPGPGAGHPLTLTFSQIDTGNASAVAESRTLITDVLGRVRSRTDRQNRVTQILYGSEPVTPLPPGAPGPVFNRTVTVTLPPAASGLNPGTIVLKYDALGRLISRTEPGGTRTFVYADLERTVTLRDEAGRSEVVTLDELGRVASVAGGGTGPGDDLPLTRAYRYDPLGRLSRTDETGSFGATGANVRTISTNFAYSFDATISGPCVTVTGPFVATAGSGPTQVLVYDAAGRLRKHIPDGNALYTRTWEYSAQGLNLSFTNARGQTVQYAYDNLGRFLSVAWPDPVDSTQTLSLAHTLDDAGRRENTNLLRGGTTVASVARSFDADGRLLSRTLSANGTARAIEYAYYPEGALRTLTYPGGDFVRYDYDGLDRLTGVTDWTGNLHGYTYTPEGRVATTTFQAAAGVARTTAWFGYDAAGRLSEQIQLRADGTILAYESLAAGTAPGQSTGQSILPLAPILAAEDRSLAVDGDNRLSEAGYDGDGNLSQTAAGAMVAYDAFGRVVGVDRPAGAGVQARADLFDFDPDGSRAGVTLGATRRTFLVDPREFRSPLIEPVPCEFSAGVATSPMGLTSLVPDGPCACAPGVDRVLEIYDESGNRTDRFLYGTGLIARARSAEGLELYRFDARGSTLALTDEAGAVLAAYAYDVYGRKTASSGDDGNNPFLYNGRDGVQDDGNGLLYLRARSVDPVYRRFATKDFLFGDANAPDTLNPYAFLDGDPVRRVDPLGLVASAMGLGWGAIAAIAAIVGIAVVAGLIYALGQDSDSPVADRDNGPFGGGDPTSDLLQAMGSVEGECPCTVAGVSVARGPVTLPGVGLGPVPGIPGIPAPGRADLPGLPGGPGMPIRMIPLPDLLREIKAPGLPDVSGMRRSRVTAADFLRGLSQGKIVWKI